MSHVAAVRKDCDPHAAEIDRARAQGPQPVESSGDHEGASSPPHKTNLARQNSKNWWSGRSTCSRPSKATSTQRRFRPQQNPNRSLGQAGRPPPCRAGRRQHPEAYLQGTKPSTASKRGTNSTSRIWRPDPLPNPPIWPPWTEPAGGRRPQASDLLYLVD